MEKTRRMTINQEKFGEAIAKLDSLQESVDSIESRLFGNGKPGIIVDMAIMTETLEKLIARVECIDKRDTPDKWIVKHWKELLFAMTSFFLLVHSLIPKDLSLWDWLTKIF